ncbi:ATP phosphoribosyltransferase regulatory subunit [Caulobacter sp. CCUG 60055]|uniref:ATP phosphoribosyltransferase regulatory subunit n=1 Tax=Caulobacter sp. CCUG 60055 TaxID=2100090 RepID=UPI001FA6DECF|nr:ATP phosphoribosyltransferase regulatory subunit [Caulobacteraceae bacterium]
MRLEPAVPAAVLAAVRAPFLDHGASLLDPAVMQPLTLMLDLAGEAMRARLFVVQGEGGEEACLRPDFTVPVARAHIEAGAVEGRYLYEGKAFRVAPKGSGRAEEFLQIGVEAFEAAEGAEARARADAGMAALAWRASLAGGRDDLRMQLGDVSLFADFVRALDLPPALGGRLIRAFARPRTLKAELERAQAGEPEARNGDRLSALLAELPEAEAAAVLEELWALAGIQPVGGRSPAEIVHRLSQRSEAARAPRLTAVQADLIGRFLSVADRPRGALDAVAALARAGGADLDAALQGWAIRLDALFADGVPEARTTLAAAFGRAFGYYDGALFEVTSDSLDAERPVAGGGRYDGLLARLGAKGAAGAVGCMVRPARAWKGAGA